MSIRTNNKQKVRVQTFNLGQNSAAEPGVLTPGFASLIENGTITDLGKCAQRKGLTRTGENPDTLISEWRFDDGTSDDSKGSNDGTDTSITYVDGQFGKAASFNGTTSSIVVSQDSSIDVNSMGPFRISCWIYVKSDGENNVGRIVDKLESVVTQGGYSLNVQNEVADTVKLRFVVLHATTDMDVITSTTIPINTWTKIDAVYHTDKSGDIYINGAIASYGTDTAGVGSVEDDSGNDLYIGNRSNPNRSFDGYIDMLQIYDGNFNAAQIAVDRIYGLTRYEVGTTVDRVYRIVNTSLQRLDDDFKDWTDIDTGFTADLVTNFVQAKDILFILNGTENVHTMDSGENITDEGNTNADPPRTTVGEYMPNNRLFLSGSKTIAERDYVWFSDSLDPQTFDRNVNVFKVRSGGGGAIKALKQFRQDELIIYKEDSIFMLSNTFGSTPLTDWTLTVVNPNIGCKAGRSVINLGNEHIFLSDDGVRLLTRTEFDTIRNGIVSEPVNDIILRINKDAIDTACAGFVDNKYVLAVPIDSATQPNYILIWDRIATKNTGNLNSGWTVIPTDTWQPSVFQTFEFSDNKTTLLMGDNRNFSTVYKCFSGNTDNGATIEMKLDTIEHFADGVQKAIWYPLHVVAESTNSTQVNISASGDTTEFRDIGNYDVSQGSGVDFPVDFPISFAGGTKKDIGFFNPKKLGRSRSIKIRFIHNQYNKSVKINEYTLYAKVKG